MSKPKRVFSGPYTLEAIEKELRQTQAEIQEYLALMQYQTDLQQMRTLMLRMSGKSNTPQTAVSVAVVLGSGTSEYARKALASNGPQSLKSLLRIMRELGWKGSGDDAVDQKRIYASMFRMKGVFERTADRKWRVKT